MPDEPPLSNWKRPVEPVGYVVDSSKPLPSAT